VAEFCLQLRYSLDGTPITRDEVFHEKSNLENRASIAADFDDSNHPRHSGVSTVSGCSLCMISDAQDFIAKEINRLSQSMGI
jgi:hypothetical protein